MDGTEVWIHGWDVCRGWTKACMGWPQLRCCQVNALFFPYASPSAKAEGSADIQFVFVNSKNWTVRLSLQDVTAVIEECMEDGVPWFDSTRLKTWDTSGRSGRYVQSTVMSQLTRFQSFKGQFLKRSLVRSQIVNW